MTKRKVFISYSWSESTQAFAEKLAAYLNTEPTIVSAWDGEERRTGGFEDYLAESIRTSEAIVVLVNQYTYAHDRKLWTWELPLVMERIRTIGEHRLIPLLIQDCVGWRDGLGIEGFKPLSSFNPANSRTGKKWTLLAECNEAGQEKQYDRVLVKVRAALETVAVPMIVTAPLRALARQPEVRWSTWREVEIQGTSYRLSSIHPDTLQIMDSAMLAESPEAANHDTLVVDASGRVAAHLRGGTIRLSWLNRFSPEVHPWPRTVQLPAPKPTRLLAIAMLGGHGVQLVVNRGGKTVRLTAAWPAEAKAEMAILEGKPSRAAIFIQGRAIAVSMDGQYAGHLGLGLDRIDSIDAGETSAGRIVAAVGRRQDEYGLAISSGAHSWIRLTEGSIGVVVVRNTRTAPQVLTYSGRLITRYTLDRSQSRWIGPA